MSLNKLIKGELLLWFLDIMSKSQKWHNKKHLQEWFNKLTPEQRLKIALQVEKFRREARFVKP
jgi:hypothetical protein